MNPLTERRIHQTIAFKNIEDRGRSLRGKWLLPASSRTRRRHCPIRTAHTVIAHAPLHGGVFLVVKSAALAAFRCFASRSIAPSMPMTV